MDELIEKAEGANPAKAEFGCGAFDDGSGYGVTVGYDTTEKGVFAGHILLDGFAVTFPEKDAEEVIAAIRYCAAALRARKDTDNGQ